MRAIAVSALVGAALSLGGCGSSSATSSTAPGPPSRAALAKALRDGGYAPSAEGARCMVQELLGKLGAADLEAVVAANLPKGSPASAAIAVAQADCLNSLNGSRP